MLISIGRHGPPSPPPPPSLLHQWNCFLFFFLVGFTNQFVLTRSKSPSRQDVWTLTLTDSGWSVETVHERSGYSAGICPSCPRFIWSCWPFADCCAAFQSSRLLKPIESVRLIRFDSVGSDDGPNSNAPLATKKENRKQRVAVVLNFTAAGW